MGNYYFSDPPDVFPLWLESQLRFLQEGSHTAPAVLVPRGVALQLPGGNYMVRLWSRLAQLIWKTFEHAFILKKSTHTLSQWEGREVETVNLN